jgi:hypothetical protein
VWLNQLRAGLSMLLLATLMTMRLHCSELAWVRL